jgi:flagellar motor switch protein FliN/FliY
MCLVQRFNEKSMSPKRSLTSRAESIVSLINQNWSKQLPDETPKSKTTPFSNVPVEITVSVGRARPSIRDLLDLTENSVLTLDKTVDAPVDLFIGDRLVGRGQLEEAEEGAPEMLAVRITEIVEPDMGTL